MPNKEFLRFNFTEPVKEAEDLTRFLETKQQSVKSKLSQKQGGANGHAWIIIFVLIFSLIGLGVYSVLKNRENENQIASLKNQTGANTPEENTKNIITADNFSLILNTPTPSNFAIKRQVLPSPFLDGKEVVQTSFLGANTKTGQELFSGIEVQISEFDNKMDKTLFEETVLTKLGEKYEVKSRDVSLPKNIKVTQIQQKNDNLDETYYITVTEDNYYIIKIYNQSSRYPEFNSTTKFTESLLPNLYLN
jgi:hypothetical protein